VWLESCLRQERWVAFLWLACREDMPRAKLARPNDEVGKFGTEDRKTVVELYNI
jgi:hypothetical protein